MPGNMSSARDHTWAHAQTANKEDACLTQSGRMRREAFVYAVTIISCLTFGV